MAAHGPRHHPGPRRGRRAPTPPTSARCRCPTRAGAARSNELHAPRKVGWSPTLGYATVDREVLAVCEAALKVLEGLGTEVVDVDPVFDDDPGLPWLTLAMAGDERSLGHLRGTDDWERLDPGHVALDGPLRGDAQRRAT